jgi:hypothetical protein
MVLLLLDSILSSSDEKRTVKTTDELQDSVLCV